MVKNSPINAGDARDIGSIQGSGRFPGVGNSNPFQYSSLENFRTEESGGLQSTGSQRIGPDWGAEHTHTQASISLSQSGGNKTCLKDLQGIE